MKYINRAMKYAIIALMLSLISCAKKDNNSSVTPFKCDRDAELLVKSMRVGDHITLDMYADWLSSTEPTAINLGNTCHRKAYHFNQINQNTLEFCYSVTIDVHCSTDTVTNIYIED